MHVVVLENRPSTECGGQELSLFDVCERLAARGHDLTLLHAHEGNLLPKYRAFCGRTVRVSGYSVDWARSLRSMARLLADATRVPSSGVDLVYANQYHDSLFARLLAGRLARPFVCHVRLAPPMRFCAQYRWGMRKATRLVAISRRTREEYIAKGFDADRVDVVHNGIDLERFTPGSDRTIQRDGLGVDRDAYVVAYAGRIDREKGLDVLIRAAASQPPDTVLLVAGLPSRAPIEDGERCLSELRALARQLGLGDRCRFLGHVADVTTLFRASDVVVLPSTCSEGFGRVLVEAMACGTPVLGSRVGGIPEVLGGEFAGWLVEPGNPSQLGDALRRMRTTVTCDLDLGRRCRAHVAAHFDVAQMVDRLERVLVGTVEEWAAGVRRYAAPALC